jgi:hypothetical protein
VNAIAAVAALSVAALTLYALLRVGVGGRLVADPSGERWHARSTPVFGGVASSSASWRESARRSRSEQPTRAARLLGILGGSAILFVAGFVDDVYTLKPGREARGAVRGRRLSSWHPGLTVEIVGKRPARDGGRARLARRDHERVQPARQHGRARRVARDGVLRRLRGRRARP